jgi:hypothetical protein
MLTDFIVITDSLDSATGGQDKPSNSQSLDGCLNWARSSDEGKDTKIAACTQEFVRRNWENFAPR